MLKLVLVAMVLVAVVHADTNTCLLRRGKKLRTFSNTKERIKIPCKYNAVRNTRCGDWRITITPGNAIEADKDKRYVVKTIWVGVERVSDGMKWEGRSDIRIAEKYLEGTKDYPFNKKDGALELDQVFTHGIMPTDDAVFLRERNGQFQITYGLYDPEDTWHRRSGFQFDCYDNTFVPTDYPTQICGDGTKDEVAEFKRAKGIKDSRQAALFFQIFTNDGIVQTDSDCASTANALSSKCKTEEQQINASSLCWPVVGKRRFQDCITNNLERPESAMRHCVEYVCSGFTDPNACLALSEEIDRCQELEGISYRVRDDCAPDLTIRT